MATEAADRTQFDPIARLLLKLRARDSVGAHEEAVLRDAISEIREFSAGQTIVHANTPLTHSALLVEGLVSRYKDLKNGQRQILEIHVPGDYVDLHGFLLKRLEHDVGALTRVKIAFAPHDKIKRITEEEPHLTRLLWFSTLVDAAVQREKILSVGRRAALARIAHFMCELFLRLDLVGLAEEKGFALPLTQIDIAEATGLTSVHVNRMLKQLRDQELMTFRGGQVAIHDWAGLQTVAEFDPAFLYLERRPH